MWKKLLLRGMVFGILGYIPQAFAQDKSCPPGQICNPIKANNFLDLILNITNALIPIATVCAVVAIIFSGFKFITASVSGKEEEIKNAKKMLTWSLIGTAIIVGAYALAKVVVDFATKL